MPAPPLQAALGHGSGCGGPERLPVCWRGECQKELHELARTIIQTTLRFSESLRISFRMLCRVCSPISRGSFGAICLFRCVSHGYAKSSFMFAASHKKHWQFCAMADPAKLLLFALLAQRCFLFVCLRHNAPLLNTYCLAQQMSIRLFDFGLGVVS